MRKKIQRRDVLKASAAFAAFTILPSGARGNPLNGKLRTAHIGVGGMGSVYQARDMRFPNVTKLCAVKEMIIAAADPPSMIKNSRRLTFSTRRSSSADSTLTGGESQRRAAHPKANPHPVNSRISQRKFKIGFTVDFPVPTLMTVIGRP